MPTKKTPDPVGRRYGKVDLDRVGFFDDVVSGPFDKYRGVVRLGDGASTRGGQILAGPRIELFEKKFDRVFAGEALSEGCRGESKKRVLERRKNPGAREFQGVGPAKRHSTPNDFFGCFGDAAALDHAPPFGESRTKAGPGELPNCKIKPNPLGGPGYADICLSPYPKHDGADPYEEVEKQPGGRTRDVKFLTASAPRSYFPPDPYQGTIPGPTYAPRRISGSRIIGPGRIYVPGPKTLGGCKAGCFGKFPPYESSPYDVKSGKNIAKGVWIGGCPSTREKYTRSIVDYGTRISCNADNYPEYKPRVYPLRF